MPLPLSPFIGWLIGIGLAWAARDGRTEPQREAPFLLSREVLIAAALAVCVYGPIVGYFVAFHGDWSYLYLLPRSSVPSAIDLIVVLASSATIPLGFAAASEPARSGRRSALLRLAAGPAVVALALTAVFARRLIVSASYAQYHGAFGTEPIFASALGRGVLLALVVLAGAIGWTVRALRS